MTFHAEYGSIGGASIQTMLEIPLFFWRYARVLARAADQAEIADLKRRFHYIFLVAYEGPAPQGFDVQEREVSLVDLSVGVAAVWSKFRHNTRNEITRAEKE